MSLVDLSVIATAVLTLFALIAAAFAAKFARDSATAAADTVGPLTTMGARLKESVDALGRLLESNQKIVSDLSSVLTVAQRVRLEDRLTHRLGQYERVTFAVQRMWEGLRRWQASMPTAYLLEAQGDLRAALAPITEEELPECRAAAGQTITNAVGEQLGAATREIKGAISRAHRDLAQLSESG